MSETVDRLLELALERGAIKYGDFTLTSGKKSSYLAWTRKAPI